MRMGIEGSALLLLLAACGLTGPAEPELPNEMEEIELRAGEERALPGTVLRLGFERVAEDSRCPVGVVCVWAGNAAAEIGITAGTGPTQLLVLNTGIDPQFADFGGVRVTLLSVAPHPREGEDIPPESYVVRLRVEPLTP